MYNSILLNLVNLIMEEELKITELSKEEMQKIDGGWFWFLAGIAAGLIAGDLWSNTDNVRASCSRGRAAAEQMF